MKEDTQQMCIAIAWIIALLFMIGHDVVRYFGGSLLWQAGMNGSALVPLTYIMWVYLRRFFRKHK